MPPKAKFTKEEITAAALSIVRTESYERLTARALGKKLGSSACPVFTVFANMEEVQQAVTAAMKEVYRGYVEKGLSAKPAFKGVGVAYIRFAMEEPKLFQLLFMSEQATHPGIDRVLPVIEDSYGAILASITAEYGLGEKEAERLYQHLWVYTHGIATLCATRMCRFTAEEISDRMSEVFAALLKGMKEEKSRD